MMHEKEEIIQESFFRLAYLFESGKRLGLLLGEPESGKTRQLEDFRGEYLQRGHEVVLLDFSTQSVSLFQELLAHFEPEVKSPDETKTVSRPCGSDECWERLSKILLQKKNATPLLLLDHVDRYDRAVIDELVTLLRFHEVHEIARVFLLAVDTNYVFSLDRRLVEYVDLKLTLS